MLHPEESNRSPACAVPSTSRSHNASGQEAFNAFGPSQNGEQYSTFLLGTIKAFAVGRRKLLPVRALLDSGSHHTFVTTALAKQLANPIAIFKGGIKGLGGSQINPVGATTVRIRPFNSNEEFSAEAVVVDEISPLLPVSSISKDVIEAFSNVDLADHTYSTPGPIDMLLGIEVYTNVVKGGPQKTGMEQLYILPTVFGQAVIGKASSAHRTNESAVLFSQSQESISNQLKAFWELEEPIPGSHADPDDVRCEQHFRDTHSRDSTGRYIVRLPIRADEGFPPGNRELVLRRFFSLENKLKKDPELAFKYKEFMSEYLQLGHMSPADKPSTYVIPHHGVWQQGPGGQKLRVVFDASCPSPRSRLNGILLTGPKLQLDLCSILTSFRTYVIPICVDLVKMYRQIIVHPEDRELQHIFWRANATESLKEYALNTVTYGLRPSAFLAMRAVHQLVQDEGAQYPLAASRVLSSMYVDDFVSGANTVEEAVALKEQLEALFAKGGLTLSKWASTLKEIIPTGCKGDDPLHLQDKESEYLKILGLMWNPAEDAFSYSVCQPPHQGVTKRIMLSAIARIFDPLGLLAPVVFQAKLLMQELWKNQLDWDDPLPPNLEATWHSLIANWSLLSSISVQRYFGCYKAQSTIIGFCDASDKGYAAVIYIRVQRSDGSLKISLVKSKTKVAPLKYISTARLELCGALLLARLFSSLDISTITDRPPVCFSDSTVALSWIRKPVHLLKVFEANRVSEIQKTVPPSCWNHIRSRENPADLASRGCLPQHLRDCKLWWEGPAFLKEPIQTWNDNREDEAFECLLATQIPDKADVQQWDDQWMRRFSSFRTLIRTVARILRLQRKGTAQPPMASLPKERFFQYRAFTHTGVDYACPFQIKDSKGRNAAHRKAYLCIFVCLASKAVHLEAVTDMTTVAFLSALDRFISRRGLPQMIHSDHGSNFIGASRFMKDVYTFILRNESTFIEHLAPMRVDWKFIPPLAPHFGGLWEAGVKSVKGLLTSTIGKQALTYEELSTAFTRIEGLLNSRPLCALNEDVHNCDFLTPGHLVTGGPLFFVPEPTTDEEALSKPSRWKTVQQQVNCVWNKWRLQYLHTLQQRSKWRVASLPIKSGDLVVVKEKKGMTGHWPVARVIQAHPGDDGIVRVVTIRTPSGNTFVRGVRNLIPLFPSEPPTEDKVTRNTLPQT